MSSLDTFALEKLAALEARHLRRTLQDSTRADGPWIIRNGVRLLSFSCNDYLNLAQHPAVRDAAIKAIREHGVGAGEQVTVMVPEPSALVLLGIAAVGLIGCGWRRGRRIA